VVSGALGIGFAGIQGGVEPDVVGCGLLTSGMITSGVGDGGVVGAVGHIRVGGGE